MAQRKLLSHVPLSREKRREVCWLLQFHIRNMPQGTWETKGVIQNREEPQLRKGIHLREKGLGEKLKPSRNQERFGGQGEGALPRNVRQQLSGKGY